MFRRGKIKLAVLLAGIIVFGSVMTVSAEVITRPDTTGIPGSIYVAGAPDYYPIEYYDPETEEYQGILPAVLAEISERTGIDFTYIHGGADREQEHLAENRQVEMVSAWILEEGEAAAEYISDSVTVFSYTNEGKTISVGFAFTDIAEEVQIGAIKDAVAGLSESDIHGYLLETVMERPENRFWLILGLSLGCLVLAVGAGFLWMRNRRIREQYEKNNLLDVTTEIGNLAYFKNCFENTVTDALRPLFYMGYIMVDSDHIAGFYGSEALEDIIRYSARVLISEMKGNNIAARVADDGFAVLFQCPDDEAARQMAEELSWKLTAYTKEKNYERPVFRSVVYHLHGTDRDAELILYNLQKNCREIFEGEEPVVFCDQEMMAGAQEEKKLFAKVMNAFRDQEFVMYLQYVVDNRTKQIISAEALSRWDSREEGFIRPDKYIPLMEKTGVISRLDYYMFDKVCSQLEKWKDTDYGDLSISCNFTRVTISEEKFPEQIREIADNYLFDHNRLVIELTEDILESDRETAMQNVIACKKMGYQIALDDMGSGYTALSNLCEYPIDIVKIDRDILLKLNRRNGKELFLGMIALAHSLNLKVVCEGVETDEQNRFVTASECDYIQGWYYSRAYPPEECENFLRAYTPLTK